MHLAKFVLERLILFGDPLIKLRLHLKLQILDLLLQDGELTLHRRHLLNYEVMRLQGLLDAFQ